MVRLLCYNFAKNIVAANHTSAYGEKKEIRSMGIMRYEDMSSVQGYYDGVVVRTLEKINAKPNQRVIITVVDDFLEQSSPKPKKSMRGALADYADKELAKQEKGAWERAMVEKYGNA